MTPEPGYLLDNRTGEAGARFTALSALFDPSTFRHLTDLGVGAGWRCWEVGAGGPSVVNWLADRVGPTGAVLATDIDTSWLADTAPDTAPDTGATNVQVRLHDVAGDPPPNGELGPFDVVHARLVLVHVPDRDRALAHMVAAVRSGGWVLVEDADPALQPLSCLEETSPAEQLANKLRRGFRDLMAARGVDLAYGRKLPRLLRAAGLVDVGADASFPIAHPACRPLEQATIALIRDQLVANHIATDTEIDRHLANVAAGRLDLAQPPMVAAWGRAQQPA